MYLKKLTQEEKSSLAKELRSYVETVGGNRNFYELLETLRVRKPNPILSKRIVVEYPEGLVKWNKIIHQDNYILLKTAMEDRNSENLLPAKNHKKYKKILSMIKAFYPIEFEIIPIREFGEGFNFKIIKSSDDEKTVLNPIFELMFFTSIDYVKVILNHNG
jgi:hypothetical protein